MKVGCSKINRKIKTFVPPVLGSSYEHKTRCDDQTVIKKGGCCRSKALLSCRRAEEGLTDMVVLESRPEFLSPRSLMIAMALVLASLPGAAPDNEPESTGLSGDGHSIDTHFDSKGFMTGVENRNLGEPLLRAVSYDTMSEWGRSDVTGGVSGVGRLGGGQDADRQATDLNGKPSSPVSRKSSRRSGEDILVPPQGTAWAGVPSQRPEIELFTDAGTPPGSHRAIGSG